MSGHEIVFYLLMPYRVEAYENRLVDFMADDLVLAIQNKTTKIATDDNSLENLQRQYPNYHRYKIRVGKL